MITKIIGLAVQLSCFLFIFGCVTQKMYYFGDYSKTLYAVEKDRSDETLLKHKQELENIISESKTRSLPVPPGIYAELGYINLKANNSKEAIKHFSMEKEIYPESKLLMDRLIQKATAVDDTKTVQSQEKAATVE